MSFTGCPTTQVTERPSPVYDRLEVERYVGEEREKYAVEWDADLYTVDFFDGNLGGGCTLRVAPTSAFGLIEKEFGSSPTRWTFG